jgi:hypothetical protein
MNQHMSPASAGRLPVAKPVWAAAAALWITGALLFVAGWVEWVPFWLVPTGVALALAARVMPGLYRRRRYGSPPRIPAAIHAAAAALWILGFGLLVAAMYEWVSPLFIGPSGFALAGAHELPGWYRRRYGVSPVGGHQPAAG